MSEKTIADALERLMQSVPYSKITVAMICEETPVSRNGFYYHFDGKQQVLEWICMQNYHEDCLPFHRIEKDMIGCETFFTYIYRKKDFYRAIYDVDQGVLLHKCLMKAHSLGTDEKYAREYGRLEKNSRVKIRMDIYQNYAISGIVGVLVYWISTNYKVPLEEMTLGLHMMLTEKLPTIRDKYLY